MSNLYKLYNAIQKQSQSEAVILRKTAKRIELFDRLNHMSYNESNITLEEANEKLNLISKKIDQKNIWLTKSKFLDDSFRLNMFERRVGGFWYGNVKNRDIKYCEKFNDDFKERVRAYWNYQCFECGSPQNGKRLCVHHIHYDKKMCCNGSPEDVVPLCNSCHAKTNYNRDYWENHFTELLYAYSQEGKCFFTKNEMKDQAKRDPGEI